MQTRVEGDAEGDKRGCELQYEGDDNGDKVVFDEKMRLLCLLNGKKVVPLCAIIR